MKFDEVLAQIGEFGLYQKRLYFMLCIPTFIAAMGGVSVIFKLNIPPHRCSLGENDTYQIQDEHHAHLVNMSIPLETYRGEPVRSSCNMYNTDNNDTNWTNETVMCTSWVYDKSTFKTTVTEKFGVVCDNKILRAHSNMIGAAGEVIGTLVMGILADTFGRRPIFLLNIVIVAVVGIARTFAPNMYVYMGLGFLGGISNIAVFTTSFVIVTELTGPSHRVFVGMVIELVYCFGLFSLGLVAYFVRYWQTLQLITAVPTVLFIGFFWILPESPRWLISRGRIEEAQTVIKKIAVVNGKEIPSEMLEKITFDDSQSKVKVTQMFTSRSLLFRTLIIFFNWFVVSMVYYGLGLNVQNLSGNIYLNFTYANIVELLSYIICITLLDRLGRKILHCACMLAGGLACLGIIFPAVYGTSAIDWVTVLLNMVGKFGAAGAFAIIYVYTSELFPTMVRNSGLGTSSFFARVGSMVAPYLADLGIIVGGDLKIALPLITFGGLSVAAGLLSLFLPETVGKKLPETIEDAKNIKQSSNKNKYSLGGSDQKSEANGVDLETFNAFGDKKY